MNKVKILSIWILVLSLGVGVAAEKEGIQKKDFKEKSFFDWTGSTEGRTITILGTATAAAGYFILSNSMQNAYRRPIKAAEADVKDLLRAEELSGNLDYNPSCFGVFSQIASRVSAIVSHGRRRAGLDSKRTAIEEAAENFLEATKEGRTPTEEQARAFSDAMVRWADINLVRELGVQWYRLEPIGYIGRGFVNGVRILPLRILRLTQFTGQETTGFRLFKRGTFSGILVQGVGEAFVIVGLTWAVDKLLVPGLMSSMYGSIKAGASIPFFFFPQLFGGAAKVDEERDKIAPIEAAARKGLIAEAAGLEGQQKAAAEDLKLEASALFLDLRRMKAVWDQTEGLGVTVEGKNEGDVATAKAIPFLLKDNKETQRAELLRWEKVILQYVENQMKGQENAVVDSKDEMTQKEILARYLEDLLREKRYAQDVENALNVEAAELPSTRKKLSRLAAADFLRKLKAASEAKKEPKGEKKPEGKEGEKPLDLE